MLEDMKIKLEEYYDYIIEINESLSDALHGIHSIIKDRVK